MSVSTDGKGRVWVVGGDETRYVPSSGKGRYVYTRNDSSPVPTTLPDTLPVLRPAWEFPTGGRRVTSRPKTHSERVESQGPGLSLFVGVRGVSGASTGG